MVGDRDMGEMTKALRLDDALRDDIERYAADLDVCLLGARELLQNRSSAHHLRAPACFSPPVFLHNLRAPPSYAVPSRAAARL